MRVRKMLSCVLMMTLLLTACGRGGEESPEQLAGVIRGEYLSVPGWQATAEITAAYGEEVYAFTLDARWSREGESVLTLVEPKILAGITARIKAGEGVLEYDGAGLSVGLLDEQGLTPVSALPALMDQLTAGYMARCSWEGEKEEGRTLKILCRDPEGEAGQGTEFALWLDPDTHALVRGEVSVDGAVRVTVTFREFTFDKTQSTEMNEDDGANHEDLG